MSNSAPFLTVAKNLLREKRYQEAIDTFEKIVGDQTQYSAEAAYCLGIIYHTGSGVPKSIKQAEQFYLVAARASHSEAIFRLARLHFDRGDYQTAYNLFKPIALKNPAAAYWASRVLSAHANLDSDAHAGENYLISAARRGHVRAQRVLALRYAFGKEGLSKVPYGLSLCAQVLCNIVRAVNDGDKTKYE